MLTKSGVLINPTQEKTTGTISSDDFAAGSFNNASRERRSFLTARPGGIEVTRPFEDRSNCW